MIEVFRTTVNDPMSANIIIEKLTNLIPSGRINFDLTDCDRILRVKSPEQVRTEKIIGIVRSFGFEIDVLEDIPATYTRPMAV